MSFKISGYTTTRNSVDMDYPFVESISSMMEFCEEVCVLDSSDKQDGTWEKLVELQNKFPGKLKIRHENIDWGAPNHGIFDGQTKQMAREMCRGQYLWQMDCVPPDTKIMTDKGEKQIVDIKVNDFVLTHTGKFQRVIKFFEKPEGQYELYCYKKLGDNRSLKVTGNHPVFFIDSKAKQIWAKPDTNPDLKRLSFAFPKLKIQTLNVIDIPISLGKNKNKLTNQKLDFDLGFLIGTYLGDGMVIFNKKRPQYIRWTFNIKENETIQKLQNIIENKFGLKTSIGFEGRKNEKWIQVRNHKLSEWFLTNFATGSKNKIIKDFSLFSNELINGLMDGLHQSDGSTDKKYFKIDLTNSQLLSQIKLLLTKIGLYASISELSNKTGYKTSNLKYYRLALSGKQLKKIKMLFTKNNINTSKLSKQFFKENDNVFYHTAFSNVRIENYYGKLYNLEVENDNSYVANGVIVHNCDEIVHEDHAPLIRPLITQIGAEFQKIPILALPVVEFWGRTGKVRIDVNPWKWRITLNIKDITHGIPLELRTTDPVSGLEYAKPGTDTCDYISKATGERYQCMFFIPQELEKARISAIRTNPFDPNLKAFETWFNGALQQIPGVYHYSWFNIERKIRQYRLFWSDFWKAMYNETRDERNNPFFPGHLWSEVTEEMIKNTASALEINTGGHIFHKPFDNVFTNSIRVWKDHPKIMNDWINLHK